MKLVMQLSDLFGRQIKEQEVPESLITNSACHSFSAFTRRGQNVICVRCGSQINKQETKLAIDHFYCANCLQMGRLTSSDNLITINEPNQFNYTGSCQWQGVLTNDQRNCAKQVIASIDKRIDRLLWAVTGAGKTEMLFPGLEHAFRQQLRVAVVSPRIDVILELAPRLRTAFPDVTSCLLYGKTTEKYSYTQLVIATVHQLLRFYHAFDVLIIDEVDVFPLAGNKQLHYAIQRAKKVTSSVIYLTATPDTTLKQQVKATKLAVSYLPRRFHGFPLATITNVKVGNWRARLTQRKLPPQLVTAIEQRIIKQQPFLLFVPHIADLKLVSEILKPRLNLPIITVHAKDPKRVDKVRQMRNKETLFLVTTTILERGVTFPLIDVLVLGADDDIFSAAALIQIAGRVGRNVKRPSGDVYFYLHKRTNAIKQAQREIKMMNKKAGFK
ncbi:helicase-related protein [Lentilactobacillus senioris]|uniref:DEAD/DEAH box helicase n=1 Tax=Lentilactobacillus senioris TaxID=931534 RepID=UPI00228227A2|nr:helicase-related protein [Lentilactobacillus senioris]MCY9807181.1 helicase-related protein [Lentilactobacillus senioris]